MVSFEKRIHHYFPAECEWILVQNRIAQTGCSVNQAESLAETIAEGCDYSEDDVPVEIDRLLGKFFELGEESYCSAVEETFLKLLRKRKCAYSAYLGKLSENGADTRVLRDACIFKIVQLAVLFNASSDYMVKPIASFEKINSVSTDYTCGGRETVMFKEYTKCAKELIKVYKGLINKK